MSIKIQQANTFVLFGHCVRIRFEVFVTEQNVPSHEELTGQEDEFIHFIAQDTTSEEYIGTALYEVIDDQTIHIRRVAVSQSHRKQGIGQMLIDYIEQFARTKGFKVSELDAQVQAIPFYEKLGYVVDSDVFLDAGIEHRTMKKDLQ